jgi:glycosyltransferase involved in cell wall biosynthesis
MSVGREEKPSISICLTFKDRANYLDAFFKGLFEQKYDSKKIQICIADGGSKDSWKSSVEKYYSRFHSIKTAFCDRRELPFEVASNCPATDRNALCTNMSDTEKIIVTDPEVLFTNNSQLQWIDESLNQKELLIYHSCLRLSKDSTPMGRVIKYGGFCLCFNRSEFLRNGGFDERYSLGFAGEDSYFIWWWSKNRKAISGKYKVLHLWHPSPSSNKSYCELRKTYTLPLHIRLKKANAVPNKGLGSDWHRTETLKDLKIWKQ